MYSSIQLAFKYLGYYFSAASGKGHGIHSPFLFDFIASVLNDKKHYPAYDTMERFRRLLLTNSSEVPVADFGAGTGIDRPDRRTVASIAKHAAKPKKYGQLLYRIVQYYKPTSLLELGTSLGITTAYLSFARPEAAITTLEGAPAVATIARANFKELAVQNIQLIEGNFDDTLAGTVHSLSSLDFVFIDGNHREEPTIRYFKTILPKINNNTVIVFDDIHWSPGMERAWQTIKEHASVKCSIDLFFIGLVFFREEFHEKQHFVIRF